MNQELKEAIERRKRQLGGVSEPEEPKKQPPKSEIMPHSQGFNENKKKL